jgi:hypothetical protein
MTLLDQQLAEVRAEEPGASCDQYPMPHFTPHTATGDHDTDTKIQSRRPVGSYS